jgi:hypothetical protein
MIANGHGNCIACGQTELTDTNIMEITVCLNCTLHPMTGRTPHPSGHNSKLNISLKMLHISFVHVAPLRSAAIRTWHAAAAAAAAARTVSGEKSRGELNKSQARRSISYSSCSKSEPGLTYLINVTCLPIAVLLIGWLCQQINIIYQNCKAIYL